MTRTRVLLAGLVLVFGSAVFAACSSEKAAVTPTDPTLAEGQQIYNSNCASCHGTTGGGGYGPKLAGRVATKYPDIADEIKVIIEGKGSMPAWGKKLSAEQIDAVAQYTRWLGTEN